MQHFSYHYRIKTILKGSSQVISIIIILLFYTNHVISQDFDMSRYRQDLDQFQYGQDLRTIKDPAGLEWKWDQKDIQTRGAFQVLTYKKGNATLEVPYKGVILLYKDTKHRNLMEIVGVRSSEQGHNVSQLSSGLSSMKLMGNIKAKFYRQPAYQGNISVDLYPGKYSYLLDRNDEFKSVKIDPTPPGTRWVILYEDKECKGNFHAIGPGDYAESASLLRHDAFSSIHVPPGYYVYAWHDTNFTGTNNENSPFLYDSRDQCENLVGFDNEISSLKIGLVDYELTKTEILKVYEDSELSTPTNFYFQGSNQGYTKDKITYSGGGTVKKRRTAIFTEETTEEFSLSTSITTGFSIDIPGTGAGVGSELTITGSIANSSTTGNSIEESESTTFEVNQAVDVGPRTGKTCKISISPVTRTYDLKYTFTPKKNQTTTSLPESISKNTVERKGKVKVEDYESKQTCWTYALDQKALRFDTESWVEFSNDNITQLPDQNDSRTIEAWIRPSAEALDAKAHNIISWGRRADKERNSIILYNGRLLFIGQFYDLRNDDISRDDLKLQADQWYHIAFTYDKTDGKMILYLDGTPYLTKTGLTELNTNIEVDKPFLRFGRNAKPYDDEHYSGALDEVRIWNTVRKPQDIFNNKDKELKGDEEGLVMYFDFNQDQAKVEGSNEGLTRISARTGTAIGVLKGFKLTEGSSSNYVGGPQKLQKRSGSVSSN